MVPADGSCPLRWGLVAGCGIWHTTGWRHWTIGASWSRHVRRIKGLEGSPILFAGQMVYAGCPIVFGFVKSLVLRGSSAFQGVFSSNNGYE